MLVVIDASDLIDESGDKSSLLEYFAERCVTWNSMLNRELYHFISSTKVLTESRVPGAEG